MRDVAFGEFLRGRSADLALAAAVSAVVSACGGDNLGPPVPTSITVIPETVVLDALGDTAVLVARVLDQHGAALSGLAVSWTSGNESVATASGVGLVTAVGNGTAVITARAGGATGQARVVVEQRVASVVVAPDSLMFEALGDTALLAAEALDPNGAIVAGVTVSWSSGNESVATMNGAGLATAVGNGTAVVTAYARGATGRARVVVEQRVVSVVVPPDSLMFDALGDTASLVAEALDPNGAVVAGAAVSWSSGDESVATVRDTGLVTAVGNGTAAVTASAGGATGQARVVVEQRVASVVVAPDSLVFDALGDTALMVAEALDPNGAVVAGVAVSWSSKDESIATVSGTGVVTAVGNGLTTVTASANGAEDQARVAVEQRVDSVIIIPDSLILNGAADTTSLVAEVLDANGAVVFGAVASWSIGDESVATVSDAGLVTAVGPGTTAVTADVEGHQGSAIVIVSNPDRAALVALYNATNGASWFIKTNWLSAAPLNEWYGVDTHADGRVSALGLAANGLSDTLPPELGNLSRVVHLFLDRNSLAGTIPDEMTSLRALEYITVDSSVCAPATPTFERWVAGIDTHNITYCPAPPLDESIAYVMQAVPSSNYSVPLVAGDAGLLRVFVTADNPDGVGIPPVRATFYAGGTAVHTSEIPARPNTPIPATVEEGDFSRSANAEIPGSVLTPGLEMVVEIDPDGTLGSAVEVVSRIPETGRARLDVRAVDVFDLTVIPFLLTSRPDSTLLELTSALGPDHDLFRLTRTILPIGDMKVVVHDPVWTSSRDAYDLIRLVRTTRAAEEGGGYWMGMLRNPTAAGGLAYVGGFVSFSLPWSEVIAHELGHNLSLRHAPCGLAPGPDPAYPYKNGRIGIWGWDRGTIRLVSPSVADVMGYCGPPDWISDYHFSKAFNHRASRSAPMSSPVPSAIQQTLLLWGGADAGGNVFLHPAFVIDAPPSVPEAGGAYRVTGEAEDGSVLFSLDFEMEEIADGDGGYGFAFAVPVEPSWAATLARVTLTGGGSSATLGREGAEAAVLLRDPATGQVRGLLLDVPIDPDAQADWLTPLSVQNMDVQISRGIPAVNVWQR